MLATSTKMNQGRKMNPKRGGATTLSTTTLLSYVFICASFFYAGIVVGTNSTVTAGIAPGNDCTPNERNPEREKLMTKIKQQAKNIFELKEKLRQAEQKQFDNAEVKGADDTEARFSSEVDAIANGMAYVDRTTFAQRFDVGVPLQESVTGNEQVLLLYSTSKSLPSSDPYKFAETKSNTKIPFFDDIEAATENCDTMNLILAQPFEPGQCFAMMGQYRSYHLQKFMRLPMRAGEKLDRSAPLRLVNRGAQSSGRLSHQVPTKEMTLSYWQSLTTYFQHWDATVQALSPIAEKVAVNNTLVVMVANHGHSELLMNFACTSRARGLDISQVLVFATDEETKELAEGLGMHSFYDEKNYGHLPKEAAGRYADRTFTAMMMAKVYCVQMTIMMGYDVLFQDVDVVWYQNPLPFFQNKNSAMYNFDVYFQDDGSRQVFYSPYSANTGVYFIRNNDKTRHFFNSLLAAGDLITATHSHQIALIALLSEHASLYNLKVKVLSREDDEFPGGYTFHRRQSYMKSLFEGRVKPYLFHMSWTHNKEPKTKFFRQMGNWHLHDKCIGSTADKIRSEQSVKGDLQAADGDNGKIGDLVQPCCSKEPLISCFYRDKPSIVKCNDSPNLDKGKAPFWGKQE